MARAAAFTSASPRNYEVTETGSITMEGFHETFELTPGCGACEPHHASRIWSPRRCGDHRSDDHRGDGLSFCERRLWPAQGADAVCTKRTAPHRKMQGGGASSRHEFVVVLARMLGRPIVRLLLTF